MTKVTLAKAFIRVVFIVVASPVILVIGTLVGFTVLVEWAFEPESTRIRRQNNKKALRAYR
jgi:hypothetical protein